MARIFTGCTHSYEFDDGGKAMRSKIFGTFVMLVTLVGLAACGEKPVPQKTVIVTREVVATRQATPVVVTVVATEQPAVVAPEPNAAPTTRPGYFSRDELIEDSRQLADILESTHPDPYINGGGRIAFHRRLQRILNSIPEEGMTKEEYIRLLRPFVAALGDSHTRVWDGYAVSSSRPGGVPLQFAIVKESLYVAGVPRSLPQEFLGYLLVSVEGLPVDELVERQTRLIGCENEIYALAFLAIESLWSAPYMQELIPEWEDTGRVSVRLQSPTGDIVEYDFDLPVFMSPLTTRETQVALPTTDDSGFRYDVLDSEGRMVYLRVADMTNYREAHESWACMSEGSSALEDEERFSSIPSATETFRDMVVEMEKAGTETLIVDLRDNTGGTSLMSDILVYFLYGRDALTSIDASSITRGGGEVRRYSALFLESHQGMTLESLNEGRDVPLVEGDYDFSYFAVDKMPASVEDWYRMAPTFYAEYESEAYSGYYRPENVIVLVNPRTYSSGYTMERKLYLAGAVLIGTSSAQAGNCFGEIDDWRLDHTGIEGKVSHGYYVDFPNDPELGHILPVDYPLTYELLASYDFDPNAEYLYALELLPELGETASARRVMDAGPKPTETAPKPTATASSSAGHYSREELIEDARQLADILESAHPDPYIRGGGKVAFHHRLHQLLNAIPEEGMTRDEFIRLLRPFIAAVGDGHTAIGDSYRVNDYAPGGVPLRFDVVEQSLYVSGVFREEDRDLIGARLVSVEGVPVSELCERQERLQGTENIYHVLQLLAGSSLWYRPYMQDLLPEWEDTSCVSVELQLPSGEIRELDFDLPVRMGAMLTPESRITLPSTDDFGFGYEFLDAEGKTAYLRIDHMSYYREAYEIWNTAGSRKTTESERARIKSATRTFRSLVVDMEEAGTETLIVDLRNNEGGHSLMADILIYFLYSREDFLAVVTHTPATGGGKIIRYSHLYFESCSNESIEDYNVGRAVPLIEGDYCFDDDFTDDEEKVRNLSQESETPAFVEEWVNRSPTFYAEFQSGAYGGYYRPERVVVLVKSGTFSSGFTLARYLYFAGATLVGTPSAQASNCFGEINWWELEHTKIRGGVSDAYFVDFPDDPEVGRVLPVHYPLTYEKLASYDFDPNAEFLYALELLPELGE
jgi:hypothetical protein